MSAVAMLCALIVVFLVYCAISLGTVFHREAWILSAPHRAGAVAALAFVLLVCVLSAALGLSCGFLLWGRA